jgi:hypothetical protein
MPKSSTEKAKENHKNQPESIQRAMAFRATGGNAKMINVYAVGSIEWGLFSWLMLLLGSVALVGICVVWQMLGGNPRRKEIDDTRPDASDPSWLDDRTQPQ